MSNYHIALCTDNNYLPYCFVTCQSIIDNVDRSITEEQDCITFHVIVDSSINTIDLHEKCNRFSFRNNHIINSIFILHEIDSSVFKDAPKLRGSYGAYYRILLDRIISSEVDRVLYLDVDILVRKDIRTLFNSHCFTHEVLAACIEHEVDSTSTNTVLMKSLSPMKKDLYISKTNYFNSGVLLINLKEWRAQNISEKCLSILNTHRPARHDQDLLNYVVGSRVILGMEWNFHIFNFFLGFNKKNHDYSYIPSRVNSTKEKLCNNAVPSADELELIAKNPSIVHFTYIKPWGPMDCFYSELPRVKNSSISKFIEEWHNTAKKVTEFSEELSSLEYCQFANYDFIDCLINHKVSVNQQNIDKLMKGRKKDKKGLVSAIIILLIMQIITFVILFFK